MKVNLFQYKLDIRTEYVVEEDILLNLGNLGSKTIFELSHEKQKLLIDSIFNTCMRSFFSIYLTLFDIFLVENFNSNLYLITTLREKEKVNLFMTKKTNSWISIVFSCWSRYRIHYVFVYWFKRLTYLHTSEKKFVRDDVTPYIH